jgi:hypothetical protein
MLVLKRTPFTEFLTSGEDLPRMELGQFAELVRAVVDVDPEAGYSEYALLVRLAGSDTEMAQLYFPSVLPSELLGFQNDIMTVMNLGEVVPAQRLVRKLIGDRWVVHGVDFVDEDDRNWCGAAQPRDNLVSDDSIIWSDGYHSQALGYLGLACEAFEADLKMGDPEKEMQAFVEALRDASRSKMTGCVSLLPRALQPYAANVATVLASPSMPSALKLQKLLLGDRWKIHGLIQGNEEGEWACTMLPKNAAVLRKARSGYWDNEGLAILVAILKARLIDLQSPLQRAAIQAEWGAQFGQTPSAGRMN